MFEGSEAMAAVVVVGGRIITLGTVSLPTTVAWLLVISREHYLPIRSQPSLSQLRPERFLCPNQTVSVGHEKVTTPC